MTRRRRPGRHRLVTGATATPTPGNPASRRTTRTRPATRSGRSTRDGTSGRADGGDVHVPDQMEQARTRELQTELRRREGERTRPQGELDYIDRLLKAY